MQQGRAAAAHACGLVFGVVVDQIPSAAVYGVPEVAGVGATEEELSAAGVPYVVGRCDLGRTARGAIAGHGGLLKLIFRADDRKLLGVHCFGDIASEVVGLGQVVLHVGGSVELFLTVALNTPTYSYAYHDAAIDGLTRLTEVMGLADGGNPAESRIGRSVGGCPPASNRRPRTPCSPGRVQSSPEPRSQKPSTDTWSLQEVSHGRPLLRPAGRFRPRVRHHRRVHLPQPGAARSSGARHGRLSGRHCDRAVLRRAQLPLPPPVGDGHDAPRRRSPWAADEYAVEVTFDAPVAGEGGDIVQVGRCTAPDGAELSFRVGDETPTEAPGLRVFAGVRLDPFFIDLKGAQATEVAERLAFHTDAVNSLDGMNCLSIVVELDVATVLGRDAGPLLAVVGETAARGGGRPVRLERMGRPEIKNVVMSPRKFDTVNRDLEIRDVYNAEDTFSLSRDYVGAYRARLNANLAFFDRMDGMTDWLLDDQGSHPLTELLLADFLVVDVTKPFAEDSFLEIERAVLTRRPHTHLRRPLAERRHRRHPLHRADRGARRTTDQRRRRPAVPTDLPQLSLPGPPQPGTTRPADRLRRARSVIGGGTIINTLTEEDRRFHQRPDGPATATCTPTVCRRCHPRGGGGRDPAQCGQGRRAGARLAHRVVNEGASGPRR